MSALFKERLFVFLSRFCPVRYCIVRHCGFLVGYGYSSGDASAAPRPSSRCSSSSGYLRLGGGSLNRFTNASRLSRRPWIGLTLTAMSKTGYSALLLTFVVPSKSERARPGLQQALGGKRLEYLLALLAFIGTASYWTVVHPGLTIEDDVKL